MATNPADPEFPETAEAQKPEQVLGERIKNANAGFREKTAALDKSLGERIPKLAGAAIKGLAYQFLPGGNLVAATGGALDMWASIWDKDKSFTERLLLAGKGALKATSAMGGLPGINPVIDELLPNIRRGK